MTDDIYWQPGVTLDKVEEMVIKKAMQFYGGNKTKTAASLEIAIRTLDNKLAKYGKKEVKHVSREVPGADKA